MLCHVLTLNLCYVGSVLVKSFKRFVNFIFIVSHIVTPNVFHDIYLLFIIMVCLFTHNSIFHYIHFNPDWSSGVIMVTVFI